ncbi:MAG: UDP-3-O-acyl-N-acetylglucosamine deacetylase [Planctomycetes bacterium]|nr:UDP-3-O-acyl-N-acetylglucosamine deacetylase [Planctomycetota bacterium]
MNKHDFDAVNNQKKTEDIKSNDDGLLKKHQQTINSEVSHTSIGLHLGREVTVTLKPAPENTGVVFIRTDLPEKPRLLVSVHNLVERQRRTALTVGDVEIHTIEHLLAALKGCEIDNVFVEINGPELPGSDGSAKAYVDIIVKAGTLEQDTIREYYELSNPVGVSINGATLVAMPTDKFELQIDYTLAYQHPLLQDFLSYKLEKETFINDISPARTFVLESEVQMLQLAGLGKGATTKNTLVVGETSVIENNLRFPNEFTRHKVLDLIGDISLLPKTLKAHLIAVRSGHNVNIALVRKLTEIIENEQKK